MIQYNVGRHKVGQWPQSLFLVITCLLNPSESVGLSFSIHPAAVYVLIDLNPLLSPFHFHPVARCLLSIRLNPPLGRSPQICTVLYSVTSKNVLLIP